jgi:hypothetical protein
MPQLPTHGQHLGWLQQHAVSKLMFLNSIQNLML